MENKEKKSFFKSKMFLFAILPLFILGTVLAVGYIVNNINLTVDVKEAFVVQYAILGDGGNYNGELCSDVTNWLTLENGDTFDKDGFYPMESRYVCVRIQNLGEASIPYIITSTTTGTDNLVCQYAFPNVQKTGTANNGYTLDGALVTIPADAQVINDCNVNIQVSRGTLPQ